MKVYTKYYVKDGRVHTNEFMLSRGPLGCCRVTIPGTTDSEAEDQYIGNEGLVFSAKTDEPIYKDHRVLQDWNPSKPELNVYFTLPGSKEKTVKEAKELYLGYLAVCEAALNMRYEDDIQRLMAAANADF